MTIGPTPSGQAVAPEIPHKRKRERESALPLLGINMTAMIDVVFLLLVYFMLIGSFRLSEESIQALAPQREGIGAGEDPFALPMRPIRVAVVSSGDGANDYSIQTDSAALQSATRAEEFAARLRDQSRINLPTEQRFIIEARTDTRWEHALRVFQVLQRSGFRSVTFSGAS